MNEIVSKVKTNTSTVMAKRHLISALNYQSIQSDPKQASIIKEAKRSASQLSPTNFITKSLMNLLLIFQT